jgi:uncharacterized membrane protein YheB (UPF0754 family)
MTKTSGSLLSILILSLTVSFAATAAEPVTPKLTEKLDRLLREEMRSIQTAMGQIHSAIVMGQHDKVAEQARNIYNSFILEQSLTEQDRKDLMSAVPKGFINLDKEFHKLAESLEKAGKKNDTEKQLKLFGKMTNNCVQCHSTYVSDRFPDVKPVRD